MNSLEWLRARRAEVVCAVLLCLMAANLIGQILQKTITNDETVLIPAGYYHLAAGDFSLVYEHPPLCKILCGIPLLFVQPNETTPDSIPRHLTAGDRAWEYEMKFWATNRDNFASIFFWARLPMIALTLALGVLVFVFTRKLFGALAAVFAVALFTLEPIILAHGRIVQTDVPAAFGFLLTLFWMHRYVAQPTIRNAAWIGIATALAVLAKFSMLILGPMLVVFFALRFWRDPNRTRVLGHLLSLGAAALLVINAAYLFQHRAMREDEIAGLQAKFHERAALLVPATQTLSHIVPVEFVLGILWQVMHSSEGHNAGLLGMYSKTGWWYYFPVAFALKTTLPMLLLSLAAVAWGSWRAIAKRERHFVWLLLPLGVYSVFLLFTGINIGVRYYVPGYVLLFMLGGALLARLTSYRAGVAVVAIFFACSAFITLRTYPDYMPYMNEIASARPHWWYLSDSNVEWGDDVGPLARYLLARGEHNVRAALLGGFVTLGLYGVDYVDFLADVPLPDTRYVALGASFLNGSTVPESSKRTEAERVNRFDAFRHREPEAIIGGSIYLYRMHD